MDRKKGEAKVFLSFLSLPGVVSLAVVIFPCWGQLLSDIPFLHVLSSYLETLALLIPSPLFVSLALGMLVTLFVVADF